jgi:hypothetical protein
MTKQATDEELLSLLAEFDEAEIKRRLRLHQQPICYFGESEQDRRLRLLHFFKLDKGIDYGKAEQKHKSQHERFLEKARQEQEEEEKLLQQSAEINAEKTPLDTRLFNLRMRANQCKRKNLDEVLEESNREKYEEQRKEKGLTGVWYKSKKQQRKEANDIEVTAENAAVIEEKRSKKRKHKPEGWEVHGEDTLFRAYNKRLKSIPFETKQKMVEEYVHDKQQGVVPTTTAQELQYGQEAQISEQGMNRMLTELDARQKKRDAYSRRRQFNDDEDVTYINEHNRNFNKSISRAFDKYTKEIKANLERGTAL